MANIWTVRNETTGLIKTGLLFFVAGYVLLHVFSIA